MTRTLFFYGTLCHIPLLEIVLGKSQSDFDWQAAEMADHKVTWVKDQPFPMIAARTGANASGILLQNLSTQDVARLDYYEGGFDYDLEAVVVSCNGQDIAADVYFPQPGLWHAGPDWSLTDWARDWGQVSCDTALEAMSHFGTMQRSEMTQLLPFFRARAWARHLAKTPSPTTLRLPTQASRAQLSPRPAKARGFFRLDSFQVSHPKFDGSTSAPVERSAFVAFDASLLLPYDPLSDRVMLIEQFRYGPLLRGDAHPWLLEPIAGLVDAGENPMETARREAVEEAGLHITDIRPMNALYPAPGYSTEFHHFYLGLCDLSATSGGLGGLQDEGEDIRSHVIPFDRAMDLLDSGEINEAPLAMMLLWLFRHRDTLRAQATAAG